MNDYVLLLSITGKDQVLPFQVRTKAASQQEAVSAIQAHDWGEHWIGEKGRVVRVTQVDTFDQVMSIEPPAPVVVKPKMVRRRRVR
jgi:hypothetical protein